MSAPVSTPTKKAATAQPAVVIGFKGFDKDFKCRGYQYEVGKTYVHEGTVSACELGFHACSYPLAVLSYYSLRDGSRYARVEQSGRLDHNNDKTARQIITIKAEMDIAGLVKAAVEWTKEAALSPTAGEYSHSATAGEYSNSATAGYNSHSEAKGVGAAAFNAGNGMARAGLGGAIALVERDMSKNILFVFASKVGENGIKPNTWYVLRGGKPVES